MIPAVVRGRPVLPGPPAALRYTAACPACAALCDWIATPGSPTVPDCPCGPCTPPAAHAVDDQDWCRPSCQHPDHDRSAA